MIGAGLIFTKSWNNTQIPFCSISSVQAINVVKGIIPGGPARYLSQDGDHIVCIGDVPLLNDDWTLYLYDTKGTLADLTDDSYITIDTQDNGMICKSVVLGDYVTWLQATEENETFILKGYQISTQDSFTINKASGEYYDRDGFKLVFPNQNGNDSDMTCFDLSTKNSTVICSSVKQLFLCKFSISPFHQGF